MISKNSLYSKYNLKHSIKKTFKIAFKNSFKNSFKILLVTISLFFFKIFFIFLDLDKFSIKKLLRIGN